MKRGGFLEALAEYQEAEALMARGNGCAGCPGAREGCVK